MGSGVQALSAVPTGRPSLTPEREAQLDGAPAVRDNGGDFRDFKQDETNSPGGANTEKQNAPETSTTPETTTTTVEPAPVEPAPAETVPAPEPQPTQTVPIDPATEPTP